MVSDAVPLGELRRALVIKLRHHGDVLLTSPVFQVLRNHAPAIELDALVYHDTREMLEGHPAISTVHAVGRDWRKQGALTQARHEWALLGALRERRYDLLIHFTDHPRGAWLAKLLRPRYAVAPKAANMRPFWRRAFTHLYSQPKGSPRHTVEAHLDALRRIGVQPSPNERALVMVPGKAAISEIDTQLAIAGLAPKSFVLMHPTSRWFFKMWPYDRTAALIDALGKQGQTVVLTSAPSDKERAAIKAIRTLVKAPLMDYSGRFSLKQFAALVSRAKLFIGVDSAPMHIAAAMGTPTVALFGPSGEREWGPWQVAHRVVASTAHPCRPCGQDGCGGGKVSDCLMQLPVDDVLRAVNELIDATRA